MKKSKKNSEKVRIKDIAQRANVSIGTVDRVIHNRGEVSEKTRQKILAIIKEMEYTPNILASALATQRKYRIATLMPLPLSADSYWNRPEAGVQQAVDELEKYGIEVTTFTFDQFKPDSFEKESKNILKALPDAVLMAPKFSREASRLARELAEQKIPQVFIDSRLQGFDEVPFIGQDSYRSGYLSARLMNMMLAGRGKILIVNLSKELDNQSHLQERERGFRSFFTEKSSSADYVIETLEISDYKNSDFENVLTKGIGIMQPDGIFITNSQTHRVAKIIAKSKSKRPCLIGYDLIPDNRQMMADGVIDFLICQRPMEQGYKAISFLFNILLHKRSIPMVNYTAIDIITRDNLEYYQNDTL